MSNYNKQDIEAIISRAAKLQQLSSKSDSLSRTAEKLSLEEIQDIAEEAGVSPEFVREAALEYEGIPVEEPLFLDTGNSNKVELLGFANGKINQKTWVELRSIIEYHFDNPGKGTRRPDGIIWKAKPTGILKHLSVKKSPEVEIKSTQNRSTIRIRKNLSSYNKLKLPAWIAYAIGAFIFSMLISGEANEFVPVFLAIGTLGAVGEFFRRWANRKKARQRERLKELIEKIQTIITRKSTVSGSSKKRESASIEIEESHQTEEESAPGNEEKRKIR